MKLRTGPTPMAALLAVVLAMSALPTRAADRVPVQDFFRTPAIAEAVVSPSGTHAALSIAGPTGQTALAVVELTNPKKITGVAGIEGSGVADIRWVNDRRLVFSDFDRRLGLGEATESKWLAINIDGSGFRRLIGPASTKARSEYVNSRSWLQTVLRDGSPDVLLLRCDPVEVREVAAIGSWRCAIRLDRLNTDSGGVRQLEPLSPDTSAGWITDGRGEPRLMITQERDRLRYHWREPEGRWRPVADVDALDEKGLAWQPLQVGLDGKLYVLAGSGKPSGTSVLTTLDPTTGELDPKALVSIDGFDFRGTLVWDDETKALLGIHYVSDAWGTVWLDKSLADMQKAVDELLPNTVNMIQCGNRCLSVRQVLVTAYSDVQPAVFFVYDRDLKKLDLVGASRPWIDPKQMATRELVRVTVRDGLNVPAHVTRPRDAKGPLPTVVLVHGGPYVDGADWRWSADAQFLASRGYLVVEPDYRGTMRYGFKHFKAGWKQWGLAMQDDITDVTQWAVEQGLADPKRLVIAGASYGGYATMMGLVREPELYRAGINWVGVTDILHWYNHPYSDLGDFGMRFYLPRMVGDLKADRAQLEATSPVLQAARIKRPVLMAYGALDLRVPMTHGQAMRDALKKQGVPQEWVEYAEEAHGFLKLENKVDFWTRVERFLAEHTK